MPASCLGTARSCSCAPVLRVKPFRLIRLRKDASANPLVSHGSKANDLNCPGITRLQKNGGGRGRADYRCPAIPMSAPSNIDPQATNLCSSLSPLTSTLMKTAPLSGLASTLTVFRGRISFSINTYKKVGGYPPPTSGPGVLVSGGRSFTSSPSCITFVSPRVVACAARAFWLHSPRSRRNIP